MNNSYQLQKTSNNAANSVSSSPGKASLSDLLSGNCAYPTHELEQQSTQSNSSQQYNTTKMSWRWCLMLTVFSLIGWGVVCTIFLQPMVNTLSKKSTIIVEKNVYENYSISFNAETGVITRQAVQPLQARELGSLIKYFKNNNIRKLSFNSPTDEKLFITNLVLKDIPMPAPSFDVPNLPTDRTHTITTGAPIKVLPKN